MVNSTKWTFYHFPYPIPFSERYGSFIKMPDLLTLGAMKAFALGDRAKWKDYVDLFFIMRDFHSIEQIIERTEQYFGTHFNEKLFRQQLIYFEDISYKEVVEYLPGFEVTDDEVKKGLQELALDK